MGEVDVGVQIQQIRLIDAVTADVCDVETGVCAAPSPAAEPSESTPGDSATS